MKFRESEQSRWFSEEVHPHEQPLRSYLRGAFPGIRDVDDVVQESYLRVWKARAGEPIRSAKAFLFKVARHLALDLVRRSRVSPIIAVGDLATLPVIEEGADILEEVSTREKVRLLGEAIVGLPPRCREIIILRKLKGVSQREIAARLGIAEKTIEAQVARGVNRCENYLRRRGVHSFFEP